MVEKVHFTISQDPVIDNYIESRLNLIVSKILDFIKPDSIILYGSLGRGEGTIKNTPTGIKNYSDFEIGIISGNPFIFFHVRELRKKIDIGNLGELTLSYFHPRRFTKQINSNWSLFESHFVSIEQHDLLAGMRVLYGQDPRAKKINLVADNTLKWDALRLIFNRSAELLIPISESNNELSNIDKPLNKLLIACGDAVLILTGDYHYSYSRRRELIRKNAKNLPSNVNWDMVISGYDWKLNTIAANNSINNLEEILNCVYIPILKYCTEKLFGWSFKTLEEFGQMYLAEKNLKNCSRLYPGIFVLQGCMLLIKGLLHQKRTLQCLKLVEAQGVFVEIVNQTEKVLSLYKYQNSGIFSTEEIKKLILRWEIVSSVL